MSISFIWLESGGGWGSSPITSLADYQKLKVIQKQAFHFLAGEGWQMGAESIDQPGSLSDVKHNPKMSISFFWLERGGRWGSNPSTSHANHQMLNIIQKWAFHFLAGEVWQMRFESFNLPSWSSEVESNPKMSISFLAGERWYTGFESIDQPSWSSEVEHNPKMSISLFWLERGGEWDSRPWTNPADH